MAPTLNINNDMFSIVRVELRPQLSTLSSSGEHAGLVGSGFMKNSWLPYQVSITGLCFSKDPVPAGHSFASGSSFAQNF